MKPHPTLAAAGAALLITPLLLSSGSAQAGPPTGTLTLVQLSRESQSSFVDNAPTGEGAGDAFTVAGPLRLPNTTRAGTLAAAFTQASRRAAPGTVTFRLDGGSLVVTGSLTAGDLSTLAIVGGTGIYAGAAGTMTLDSSGPRRTVFVFDFAG